MNIIKIILSLVWIIKVSDDRGSDNRGSTVHTLSEKEQLVCQSRHSITLHFLLPHQKERLLFHDCSISGLIKDR